MLRDLWEVQRDLDRLMSVFTSSPSTGLATRTGELTIPSMDVIRRDDDLVLHAEMPGIKPADIDISVTEGVLTISGTRSEETTSEETDYMVRETSYGSFERTMELPPTFDASTIHAEYRDGILEVVLPGAAQTTEPEAIHIPVTSTTSETTEVQH